MKKAIVALGLIAGALAATPSIAQDRWDDGGRGGYWQNDGRGYDGFDRRACGGGRAMRLEARIRQEAREGDLDWRTARYLRTMVDRTEGLQRRYCAYGINGWQARDLDRRFDDIERRLRAEDDDGDWRR